ncbi:flagellar basal body-associated FliL family protein [Senegalia massiliensis]|uniref:flagellar basal body-associated FliL family protein n=1 Tax=Senegalia massiliensis TaxID=1720316 RepID=UPI001031FF4C|nr:flagellar basal body-associated FliL family protein [Senegalia massiliensis]
MSFKKILIIVIIIFMLLIIVSGTVFGILFMKSDDESKESEEYYFNVGEIYSNVADSRRIVKLNLTISATNEKLIEEFNEKSFLIKDELYKILTNKKIDDIQGKESQALLKKEIIKNLEKKFSTDKISNIYFDEIIVQ